MKALMNISIFLLSLGFNLITLTLVLRMLFYSFAVDARHPFCQLLLKVTNPLVLPIRKIVPKNRYFDFSTLILLLLVEVLKYELLSYLQTGYVFGIGQLLVIIPCDIIIQTCWLLFYSLLIMVILSFIAPNLRHPFVDVIHMLSAPPARLGRKFIPSTGGFDFGPFVALVVLKVIELAITTYIPASYFF